MPQIRFIVETVSSELTRGGTRSHFAWITATKTGKRLRLQTDGERNAAGMLRRLCEWDALYCTECTISRSQWKEASKGITRYEGTTSEADILSLEQ